MGIYRLSMFEHIDWDRALFREQLDVLSFLGQIERNFASVKSEAGLDIGGSEDMDTFSNLASRIRVVRGFWDQANSTEIPSSSVPLSDHLDMSDFNMDFADEDWLRSVLGSWNE